MKRIKIIRAESKTKRVKNNIKLQAEGFNEQNEKLINENGRFFAGLSKVQPEVYFNTQNIYRF